MSFEQFYYIFLAYIQLCSSVQGGWEIDESLEEAASRESFEEAGVLGNVEVLLPLIDRD